MENRIEQLTVANTLDRTATRNDFGALLARSIASGATVASSIVPGGAVLSAAINQTAGRALAASSGGSGGGVGAVGTGWGTPGSAATIPSAAGGPTDISSFQDQLATDKASDVQYLMLQQQMQQESQVFNSVSNIMKVRYESAKTAINNIR